MKDAAGDIVSLRGFTKDYGCGRGVFDATLRVKPGEVMGFLGANGAGKTVTMRALMGFIRPTSGDARIGGLDCFRERKRTQESLGYLPGEVALPAHERACDFLDFLAAMRNIRDRSRRDELTERFEFDPTMRMGRMSKGTKQKVAIVSAFMGNPQVLLLDEPTSGLDPLMQERFVELVREERERGAAILLSSHVFPEVERACDRVAFIRAGHLRGIHSMDDVRASRRRVYRLTFSDAHQRQRYQDEICGVRGVRLVAQSGDEALDVEVAGALDAFVRDLAAYRITDLESREQTLEETFLRIYEADGRSPMEHVQRKEAIR